MRMLHPLGRGETRTCLGEYAYSRGADSSGAVERWLLTRVPGGHVYRSQIGRDLWHLLVSGERRPERIQVCLHTEHALREATCTVFEDCLAVYTPAEDQAYSELEVGADYGLGWSPYAGRILMLGSYDRALGGRQTVRVCHLAVVPDQGRWLRLVRGEYVVRPLDDPAQVVACGVEASAAYEWTPAGAANGPHVTWQRGWFDRHDVVLLWQQGEGHEMQAVLTHYERFE
jgi:hypothetical protein